MKRKTIPAQPILWQIGCTGRIVGEKASPRLLHAIGASIVGAVGVIEAVLHEIEAIAVIGVEVAIVTQNVLVVVEADAAVAARQT